MLSAGATMRADDDQIHFMLLEQLRKHLPQLALPQQDLMRDAAEAAGDQQLAHLLFGKAPRQIERAADGLGRDQLVGVRADDVRDVHLRIVPAGNRCDALLLSPIVSVIPCSLLFIWLDNLSISRFALTRSLVVPSLYPRPFAASVVIIPCT